MLRSNSTSDLDRLTPSTAKCRRKSDQSFNRLNCIDSSDSCSRLDCIEEKNQNNSDVNLSVPPRPIYWKTVDENMNSKIDYESNEFKPLSAIIEASESFGETEYIQISLDGSAMLIDDSEQLLDKDVDVHEEEIDGTVDDVETSVIKVESSDESQTTIEILPVSPVDMSSVDLTNQSDNYNESKVPVHFQLELKVGTNGENQINLPLTCVVTDSGKKGDFKENKEIRGILIDDQFGKCNFILK